MSYNDPDTLPQYRVPEDITFDTLGYYIKKILIDYSNGDISLNDVINHGEALEIFIWNKYGDKESFILPSFPYEDKRSIALEVVDYMDSMDFWILPLDVPYFIEFLETPVGKEKERWENFQKYIRSLTLRDRIKEEIKQKFTRSGILDLDKPFEPL